MLWFSRKDDWGHLYLHDAGTGFQKNRITTGDGNVTQVLRVDEAGRTIYFQGVGKESGRDPYFRHLYKIGFDGKRPDAADAGERRSHDRSVAVGKVLRRYLLDAGRAAGVRASRRDGKVVVASRKGDISQLLATGWKPPMPITVKARDGKTDLYGLMFRPTNFDAVASLPDHQQHLSRSADRQRRRPELLGGAWRCPGDRRTRLHRRPDRRHGDAVAIADVPRGVVRRHGRQHAARIRSRG